MAELTKEKILDLASETVSDSSTFEVIDDDNWLKAVLFYNTGVNDFARVLIRAMEED